MHARRGFTRVCAGCRARQLPTPPPPQPHPANTTLAPGVRAAGDLHVTGSAYSHEPGGACFCLDVKGSWAADDATGSWHVSRLVSDPDFEAGVGPVCVEVTADGGGGAGFDAGEIKRAVAARATAAVAGLRQGAQQVAHE